MFFASGSPEGGPSFLCECNYFVERWLMDNCTLGNDYCGGVDINTSGKVDLADFALFADYWLEGI